MADTDTGNSGTGLDVEEQRARSSLDTLVRCSDRLTRIRTEEERCVEGEPDPIQTFEGLAEILSFNRDRAVFEEELSDILARRNAEEERYRAATKACAFVPEGAALRHEANGRQYLIRREHPRYRYASGEGEEHSLAETASLPETAEEVLEQAEQTGESAADVLDDDKQEEAERLTVQVDGKDVLFSVFVHTDKADTVEANMSTTLAVRARTPVSERLSGPRAGRGAGRRRGRTGQERPRQ